MSDIVLEDVCPKLLYRSKIYTDTVLNKAHISRIRSILDIRYKYSDSWSLIFSTFTHGHSYKRMIESFTNTSMPYLLVCVLANGLIYFVYFEDPLRHSLRPYSSRRIVVLDQYAKDTSITYKITCSDEYVGFRSDDGSYELILHADLLQGEITCNQKMNKKFCVLHIEIWNIQE